MMELSTICKWNQRQIQNHIGYVPQDIALFEHMTVAENIKFFKSLCKNPINDTTINEYLQQLSFDAKCRQKYLHCLVWEKRKIIY